MDKGAVQRIVQRYRSPYTAVGWAFVKALRIRPRPPLPHVSEHKDAGVYDGMRECFAQDHGVEL